MWISYKEASTLFSVSIRTLRRLVNEGRVKAGPPDRIGKKGVRIYLPSLQEYFEGRTKVRSIRSAVRRRKAS